MSRIDENQKMIESVSKVRLSSPEAAAKIAVLEDISKSLAVIADCCLDDWQKRNILMSKNPKVKDVIDSMNDQQKELLHSMMCLTYDTACEEVISGLAKKGIDDGK